MDTSLYEMPKRVWTVDGHVHVETAGDTIVIMKAADALALGRVLNEAGGDALIKKIMGHD